MDTKGTIVRVEDLRRYMVEAAFAGAAYLYALTATTAIM